VSRRIGSIPGFSRRFFPPERPQSTTRAVEKSSPGTTELQNAYTMPEERISWKESNLANIGSDLDHKIKQATAEGEDAWKVIGEAPGVKVWRVEQFKIVPWPEDDYGCFYTGDSYICLNSWTVPGEDKLYHDLYIWIGAESSQDEYGTAAYKMVEADDYSGGIAVQHREVQEHESYKFKEIFGDLTYWQGGAESGFNHVEPTVEKPNLFQIKGTEKNMSLTQVNVSKSSLNKGDSFILKASAGKVWLWNGESVSCEHLMFLPSGCVIE
jgi:gelsolin